ncbi:quinone oxidoreductase family protein [Salegentibacter chungangensis]|uniref:Quinone oxidoreductase family protein n=1 Tax=Salegentibacter chungangensis TaxID=1335724 RepID=A0ABW3NMP7_9FLAO
MKALTFSKFGGPEVMEYIDMPDPEPENGEVLVEMKAIGLNYADIYRRKGNYHLEGEPPFLAGYEGAGIIRQSNSENFRVGDRVGLADVPHTNAELVVAPEEKLIPLPKGITFQNAAGILLQGLTAQYLAEASYPIKENDLVVVHAAAGGVGQVLTQLAKIRKARVIGLSRKPEKLKIISESADYAVLLDNHWKEEVMKISNNAGADAVYDSVGVTLKDSMEVTKERGTTIFYGMSGGDPDPVDPRYLMDRSLSLTGGDLWGHIKTAEDRREKAGRLFSLLKKGELKLKEPVIFKLEEGRKAHEYLEWGKSSGKVILIP